MSPNLTMAQAAQAAGLSYDRFRKVWPALCREDGFPAPIRGRTWDAEAVAAWRRTRSHRNVVALPPATASAGPASDHGRRARAQLQMLRAG
ncbi:hypothetical protein [Phenylobacterium sp.]|uniref:hypothetical protein n=1 Tax=Phenylobacterium sp. TaxID=1871053 RepID=UPI002DF6D692|nr:hypothetical protein [Phenylobacterium sp.]